MRVHQYPSVRNLYDQRASGVATPVADASRHRCNEKHRQLAARLRSTRSSLQRSELRGGKLRALDTKTQAEFRTSLSLYFSTPLSPSIVFLLGNVLSSSRFPSICQGSTQCTTMAYAGPPFLWTCPAARSHVFPELASIAVRHAHRPVAFGASSFTYSGPAPAQAHTKLRQSPPLPEKNGHSDGPSRLHTSGH